MLIIVIVLTQIKCIYIKMWLVFITNYELHEYSLFIYLFIYFFINWLKKIIM